MRHNSGEKMLLICQSNVQTPDCVAGLEYTKTALDIVEAWPDCVLLHGSYIWLKEALSKVRARTGTVVICIATEPYNSQWTVVLLRSGADDIVAQTMLPQELSLRIQARVRWLRTKSAGQHFGGLYLGQNDNTVYGPNGAKVRLRPLQADAFYKLLAKPGQVVAKEVMMNYLYGNNDAPAAKIVDVTICQLRTALTRVSSEVKIETVWGVGYKLTLPRKHTQVKPVEIAAA